MKKIKVLVIPSDLYGVGTFRFIEPHVELQKQFPEDFEVDIVQQVNFDDIDYLTQYNIIFGSKDMCPPEKAKTVLPILKENGVVIVMDIDDHWDLPVSHPHYQYSKMTKTPERITSMLDLADYVTTTTDFFANEIKKYNKNVIVFPNGVDPTAKKFQIENIESDKVRIGWLGGSSHIGDLRMLKGMFSSINDKFAGEIQTVLCGFDTRGSVTEQNENGQTNQRPITPEETCWFEYENIFTTNHKHLSPEYKTYLMQFKQEQFPNESAEQYLRRWTKHVTSYSLNYNYLDISLAPLEINKFNMSKSQLKVIESGFFKKPLIASEIAPYLIDIKHGKNGFLVKNNSGAKNWQYYATKLIQDAELRKEMGEALYETVKDKYDLRNISKARGEWFKSIVKN